MPTASNYRQRCPRCAGAVRRVRRSSREMRDETTRGMRRYRCTEEDCDWKGLLPRLARRIGRGGMSAADTRWKIWLVPLAMLALVAIGLAALSFRALHA